MDLTDPNKYIDLSYYDEAMRRRGRDYVWMR